MTKKKETVTTENIVPVVVYKRGDEVKAYGKNCKIVEVLAEGRYHCKNLESPFDSFVILVEEFE